MSMAGSNDMEAYFLRGSRNVRIKDSNIGEVGSHCRSEGSESGSSIGGASMHQCMADLSYSHCHAVLVLLTLEKHPSVHKSL